uniref:E3 ubiquitin-protein transferase MAEA n=1 Tax=Syphacia muris TaxID=451379 RepID=A0A0N5AP93_9BILA
MNPVTKVDEITALEYSALKVPYELLNKKFRIAQKAIERHNYRVKEAGAQLLQKFHDEKDGDVVPVKKIAGYAKALLERLEMLQQCLPQTVNDEFSMAKLLESRLHYLKGANSGDRWAVDTWRQQRVDRLIIDYLLRSGYFETAQKLAEHSDVQDMCNKTIFEIARQVEDSLSRHETDRCMEWILDNKSKLRRLKSNFEVIVRIQECIELVKKGENIQAVLYARKHFSNLSPQLWTSTLPLQKLMEYSTFNACLCMGISAMKTPYCKPDSLSRCPVCQPEINELADDLPFAHSLNSKLICAYSGEPLDENNPPYMLPNGRVYGQRAIELLCKDSYIRCPRTNEVFPLNTVVRVFVL